MTVTLDSTIDGTTTIDSTPGSHTQRSRVLAPPMSAGAAAPTGMVVVSVPASRPQALTSPGGPPPTNQAAAASRSLP
jgi:hypothetical protein